MYALAAAPLLVVAMGCVEEGLKGCVTHRKPLRYRPSWYGSAVADPGFPVGGCGPVRGWDL